MNTKVWHVKNGNFEIEVRNGYDWQGNTEEEIIINGKREHYYFGNFINSQNKVRAGFFFSHNIDGHTVTVLCGSAWHFFDMACKVLIDGKRVGGDRIVWFTK